MKQAMRSAAALIALFPCLPFAASFAQSPVTSPAFEVADVHRSPERLKPSVRGGLVPPDHYQLRDATMVDLISTAYSVDPSSVSTSEPWVEFDRFDIYAKAPGKTSEADAKLMLRALLADRFKLVATTSTKPLPAFVLSAGKTPKLKQAAATAEPGGCNFQPPAKGAPPAVNSVTFACRNTTMEAFVEFLHDAASPYLTRPVVDATGLKGAWDFDIQWTYQIPKDTDGITIFQAVDKQLGLKLEAKPAPLPVVGVQSISEKPTPNVAGLEKLLPPASPAQFEVAVIRPTNPEVKHFDIDMDPSGKVTIQHASLLTLIYQSYDIGPGKILNKPKFLDADLWDIMGKASTDSATPLLPDAVSDLYVDTIKEMIRSLLADRFKMTSHYDTQPAAVFALTASNPKMKKADPTGHPACKDGPGPDGKDPRIDNPVLNRLISCQNMTMAQFATELHSMAGGYLPAPVIDSTGLAGAYDFTLSFSGKKKVLAAPADSNDSSDPGGGVSLFDAVQKQLGLKLEKKDKVPQPVLVIDHIEENPTDN
jgi:uncharacterized protein (TIGR03435 family)